MIDLDKKEVVIVGIVAVIALIILFFIEGSITGRFFLTENGYDVEDYYEQRSFEKNWIVELPGMPRLPQLPTGPKKYASLPPKEELVPRVVEFRVNRILVPEKAYFSFIPIKKDEMRTFSGTFGPYFENPTDYITVFLCAYPYKVPKAPMKCERMEATYNTDGYISFARGYAQDEYIAYQALGRDFAALYLVVNDEYGVITASSMATIKLVNT